MNNITHSSKHNKRLLTPPAEINRIFLERVKQERKKCGYAQQKIADMLGIELYTYKRIENGKTALTFDTAYNIAEVLNLQLQSLTTCKEMYECEQNEAIRKTIDFLQALIK
ncbi:MAG TPA: helix-turn-helix transcriptional regulator [Sedimentibacter sp.]|nr:helix-turn-helix transcriptional regulator [Sedimentibacter sp.]